MALAAGARLGPYEIRSLLGEGGMGQVYRARDTRLDRDVAVKVLPEGFAHDPDRLARFEREAKTLASLNHTHIAHVHGFEHAGATLALVMEFVEGEDLAERLRRGALPPDEALPIARQLADGLAYAHEHGIVHRDLKPANIKVTPDGAVKILDFGLAKAFDLDPSGSGSGEQLANSPTITSPAMTQRGVVLGTAAYMSPEQARGRPVDRRTDVWAFGCVLYELLTGTRLFKGEDVTETIVSLMSKEPAWDALPASMPPTVRTLLRRCLQKDRSRRLGDMHDARLEIEDAIAGVATTEGAPTSAASAPQPSSIRRVLFWALPGAALGALLLMALQWAGVVPASSRGDARSLRVSVVHSEGWEVGTPAISPDRTRVAYRARREDGLPLLWVRDLATGEARALAGTDDAFWPFWSPDATHLGFFAGSVLKRVPADGGPIQAVTSELFQGWGASWGADGTILYAPSDISPLSQVSADGGAVRSVGALAGPDWSHLWPSFLPDGRRFLYTANQYTRAAEASGGGVFLGSLDGAPPIRLLPDLTSAVYSSTGHVVFVRAGQLTAAPFDVAGGRLSGEPFALGSPVAVDPQSNAAALSVAADGSLAVRPPPATFHAGSALLTELRMLDRRGRVLAVVPSSLYAHRMAVRPGRDEVAVQIVDPRTGTNDLYLVDLRAGTRTPVTSTKEWAGRPVWSPDGSQLAYANQTRGILDDFHVKDLRSGQDAPVVQSPTLAEQPSAWSHDGRHVLIYHFGPNGTSLKAWSFESKRLTPFIADKVTIQSEFSPDDRYVAFTSLASGQAEVMVATFPESTRTWPVTTTGGRVISWSADGREILVATLSGHIAAYPVSTAGGQFSAGQPTILVRDVGVSNIYAAATRDHSRIVIRVDPDESKDKGEIRLLFGWTNRAPTR